MRCAQQLYEGVDIDGETTGLITYMRTDGVQMAREAITAIREHVAASYGAELSAGGAARIPAARSRTRRRRTRRSGRPMSPARPTASRACLNDDQRRLYELIWKRAVASQMQSAELDQVSVDVTDGKGPTLRATGSIVAFDGFLKLYREDTDDAAGGGRRQPHAAADGGARSAEAPARWTRSQHFTQPPPRYSEASLVKKMEELGIGRPSTYASILSVLQDRKYVRLEKRRFIPEDRGRLVTAFLVSFFEHYVDTGFTAAMEEKLDDISAGQLDWRAMMHAFWDEFSKAVDQTKDLKISDVIAALDQDLGPHFFPAREDGTDPRVCAACGNGRLGLKLGPLRQLHRLLELSGLPVHAAPGDRDRRRAGRDAEGGHARPRPASGNRRGDHRPARPVRAVCAAGRERREDKKAPKPQAHLVAARHGRRPDDAGAGARPAVAAARDRPASRRRGEKIEAGIGRFGPYVRMGAVYGSLDRDDDVLAIGINRAVDLIATQDGERARRSGRIRRTRSWSRCARAASGPTCSTARRWPTCRAA